METTAFLLSLSCNRSGSGLKMLDSALCFLTCLSWRFPSIASCFTQQFFLYSSVICTIVTKAVAKLTSSFSTDTCLSLLLPFTSLQPPSCGGTKLLLCKNNLNPSHSPSSCGVLALRLIMSVVISCSSSLQVCDLTQDRM